MGAAIWSKASVAALVQMPLAAPLGFCLKEMVAELASQDSATIYDSPSGAHPDTAHTTVQSSAPPTTPPTTPLPEKPETSTTTGGGGGQGEPKQQG